MRDHQNGQLLSQAERASIRITIDGKNLCAFEGQSLAAAIMASGRRFLRYTLRRGEPRGLFCGMGVCFDCLVCVNGLQNVRACQVAVSEGMRVETQHGDGTQEMPV